MIEHKCDATCLGDTSAACETYRLFTPTAAAIAQVLEFEQHGQQAGTR
jgi:hypothetical protein